MKKLYFLFLFFVFTFLSISAQTKFKDAMYLFNSLMDCRSLNSMIKICQSHNLTDLGEENGFREFTCDDGTDIRFRIDSISPNKKAPFIQVQTDKKKKDIEKSLISLGFEKNGKVFYRGHKYGPTRILCTISSIPNSKDYLISYKKVLNR